MAVLPDVPEPADVLRLHQVRPGWRCTCGEVIAGPLAAENMAQHQLLMLASANLSVVPTNGTAAVVIAAAAVVTARVRAQAMPGTVHAQQLEPALDELTKAVNRLA